MVNLSVLRHFYSRFKTVRHYARFVLANILPRPAHDKQRVVVYLDRHFPDIRDRRYFYLILVRLLECGYQLDVVWKISFGDFRRLYRTYESLVVQLKGKRIVSKFPKASKSTMLFTNVAAVPKSGWKKVIEVSCDLLSAHQGAAQLEMPYFMHPEQYKHGTRHQLAELRTDRRQTRIFFSGNLAEEYYTNPLPEDKLTRFEIVQALRSMPGIECPSDKKQFHEMFSRGGDPSCVIHDRRVFAVPDEQWLETLARSDFFLCLPGSRMPMCHNAIEAMAVGTIPILNYAEWFEPPLEHRQTCFEFQTLEELRDCVREILNLDSSAVQAIREKVIQYYDDNLSPLGFRKKLERLPDDHVRLLVNTGYPWETEPEFLKPLEAPVKIDSSADETDGPTRSRLFQIN